MFEQLAEVVARFEEIDAALATPEIASDPKHMTKLLRERTSIEDTVVSYQRFLALQEEISATREMVQEERDAEMKAMMREELDALETERAGVEAHIKELLIPKDPRDNSNVVLEIRAGTGGEEAALFVRDLLRMYARFADSKGFKMKQLSSNEAAQGGLKEVVCVINGLGAYSLFKHESGTHRVQRIPTTESQGRIHTSAVTVAVLPEVEDVDIEIKTSDLRIDTYRASGAGGQHVNRTDSAVRITHLPTGVVVQCQDERSQHKNRDRAMSLLRTKLYDEELRKTKSEHDANRRAQVGSGDRSERIRTYNFPQNRVTDHRIGLTLHALDSVIEGGLDPVVEALLAAERTARMSTAGLD